MVLSSVLSPCPLISCSSSLGKSPPGLPSRSLATPLPGLATPGLAIPGLATPLPGLPGPFSPPLSSTGRPVVPLLLFLSLSGKSCVQACSRRCLTPPQSGGRTPSLARSTGHWKRQTAEPRDAPDSSHSLPGGKDQGPPSSRLLTWSTPRRRPSGPPGPGGSSPACCLLSAPSRRWPARWCRSLRTSPAGRR